MPSRTTSTSTGSGNLSVTQVTPPTRADLVGGPGAGVIARCRPVTRPRRIRRAGPGLGTRGAPPRHRPGRVGCRLALGVLASWARRPAVGVRDRPGRAPAVGVVTPGCCRRKRWVVRLDDGGYRVRVLRPEARRPVEATCSTSQPRPTPGPGAWCCACATGERRVPVDVVEGGADRVRRDLTAHLDRGTATAGYADAAMNTSRPDCSRTRAWVTCACCSGGVA